MARLEASDSPADFTLCVEALGNALVTAARLRRCCSKLPFWIAFAGKANAIVAPRLKQMLRQKTDEADSADQLAKKEAAVELVRCLRLEPCYPDLIAAATRRADGRGVAVRRGGHRRHAGAVSDAALSHEDSQVRKFACRAMAAVSFESGAEAVTALLADPQETHPGCGRSRHGAPAPHRRPPRHGRTPGRRIEQRPHGAIQALARMDARLVTMALLRNPKVLSEQQLPVLSIMRANPHPLQRGYVETSLASPDEQVRHAAVAAFAAQRGADVVEALAPMLADKSVEVRRSVIVALSERPCERTRQLLLGLLERDRETRVRRHPRRWVESGTRASSPS